MMVFPANMSPQALLQNSGEPYEFTCSVCSTTETGRRIRPDDSKREDWAVLPEEWAEIEDRRPYAKEQFVIVCGSADCAHEARTHEAGGQ